MREFFEGGDGGLEGGEFFEDRVVSCIQTAGGEVGVCVEIVKGVSEFAVYSYSLACPQLNQTEMPEPQTPKLLISPVSPLLPKPKL